MWFIIIKRNYLLVTLWSKGVNWLMTIYSQCSLWYFQVTMHLYALTLQKASTINHAIHGNFSGSKQQEIVISRGKIIELLRPDPNTGKVFPLLAMEMFGVIRDLIAFRLTGGSKGEYLFKFMLQLSGWFFFLLWLAKVLACSTTFWIIFSNFHVSPPLSHFSVACCYKMPTDFREQFFGGNGKTYDN